MARLNKALFGIEARDAYFKGADKVAEVVIKSMGPFGLNLAMEKGRKTTNDGKLISERLSATVADEFERQGALMQHEAADDTEKEVFDGTSMTIGVTSQLRKELLKHLPTKTRFVSLKTIPELESKLEAEKEFIFSELDKVVKKIESKEELIASAKVSVEDNKLAELIGSTQWDLGADGRIVPEEVNEDECSVELVDGIMVDNGFVSSLMINNDAEQALEVNDGAILLTNHTIGVKEFDSLKNLITLLASTKQTKLVIIARAFTQDVIQILLGLQQNGFACFPINAPYTNQAQILKDLEAVTGATYFDQDTNSFEDISIQHLGKFSKIKMRIHGGIIAGTGNEEKIAARIAQLERAVQGEKSTYEIKNIEARIADLKGKKALLKIGSISKADRSRLKDKADDAVGAVRMALKGGTVKGAGQTLKEISDKMDDDSLLKRPIQIVYDTIISSAPSDFIIQEWVRDPVLVIKSAITNACKNAINMSRIMAADVTRDLKPKEQSYEDEN